MFDHDRWRTDFEKEPLPASGYFRVWAVKSQVELLACMEGRLLIVLTDTGWCGEVAFPDTFEKYTAWRPRAVGPESQNVV